MKGIKINTEITLKQGFTIPSGIVLISEVYVPLGIKQRRIEDKTNSNIGVSVFANEDAIANGKDPVQCEQIPQMFAALIPDKALEEQKSMEMLIGFVYNELDKIFKGKCEIVTV